MSSSEVPDINLTFARSLTSTFSQKLRLIWNGMKQNDSSSQYSWKRRLRWQGGRQKAPISTLSDKEIGGYTLRASPASSPASHTTYASERRCVYCNGCNFWHETLIYSLLSLYFIHFSRTPNEESPFTYWNISIKLLAAMVIFGIGWIVGFVVRWGVHHYYIDPKGHCITPRLYR